MHRLVPFATVLLTLLAGIWLFAPSATGGDKLPSPGAYTVTDTAGNYVGAIHVVGDTIFYDSVSGGTSAWDWRADLGGYKNGNRVWKFDLSAGTYVVCTSGGADVPGTFDESTVNVPPSGV